MKEETVCGRSPFCTSPLFLCGSFAVLGTELAECHALDLAEELVEHLRRGEADERGNLFSGIIGVKQVVFRVIQAVDVQRALEALAEIVFKHAVDVARGDVECVGDVLHGDVFVVIGMHVFGDRDGEVDLGGFRLLRLCHAAQDAAENRDEILLIECVDHQAVPGGGMDDLLMERAEHSAAPELLLADKIAAAFELAEGLGYKIVLSFGAPALPAGGSGGGGTEDENRIALGNSGGSQARAGGTSRRSA